MDSDGDGKADFIDTDSDDDGVLDWAESGINRITGATSSNVNGGINNPKDDLDNTHISGTVELDFREADSHQVITKEDITKVLAMADFGYTDTSGFSSSAKLKVTSMSSDGTLQKQGGAVGWQSVSANDELLVSDISAGNLRFVPDANESGYDNYPHCWSGQPEARLRQDWLPAERWLARVGGQQPDD